MVYLHEPESFWPLAQASQAQDGAVSVRHYQLDHIGTPVAMTNDDGRTVLRSRAWGGSGDRPGGRSRRAEIYKQAAGRRATTETSVSDAKVC